MAGRHHRSALIVRVGVVLFLQGRELGVFPIGKNLSDEFVREGSLALLMVFGFCQSVFGTTADRQARSH